MNFLKLFFLLGIFSLPWGIVHKGYSITPEQQGKLNQELLFEAGKDIPDLQKIRQLIQDGAEVDTADGGFTPLDSALRPSKKLNLQVILLLLQSGANPNYYPPQWSLHYRISPLEKILDRYLHLSSSARDANTAPEELSQVLLPVLRYLVLYGGRILDNWKIIGKIFPQPLLQAIALGDAETVKELLHAESQGMWYQKRLPIWVLKKVGLQHEHKVVRDSNGISALAYAAGQGNEQILSLLLQYPAYQQDTTGIEQAIEIVTSRLRGLKPDTQDYKKYNHILQGLIKLLKSLHEQQLEVLLKGAEQQDPTFQDGRVPPEMLQNIMKQMLGSQDIGKLASGSEGSAK